MKQNNLNLFFLTYLCVCSSFAQDQVVKDKWVLTLEDEFHGREEGVRKGGLDHRFDADNCYSSKDSDFPAMEPICNGTNFSGHFCPEYKEQFKELNKCLWRIWAYPNYMDRPIFLDKEGEGINGFHPDLVEIHPDETVSSDDSVPFIQTGTLHIKAKYNPPGANGYKCNWPSKDEEAENPNDFSKFANCPILSGGLYSQEFLIKYDDQNRPYIKNYSQFDAEQPHTQKEILGFGQTFGRFEIRAKLSSGPTTWPAFWLLPQNMWRPRETIYYTTPSGERVNAESGAGWPETGEFDIFELRGSNPNTIYIGYGGGDLYRARTVMQSWKTEKYFPTAYDSFNTYALEWSKNEIRYLINDEVVLNKFTGDKGHIRRNKEGTSGSKYIDIVGDDPFYILLNLSMSANTDSELKSVWNKDTNSYDLTNLEKIASETKPMIIDYVRVYRQCLEADQRAGKCLLKKIKSSARMTTNVFPSPAKVGESINLSFTPFDDCEHFKFDAVEIATGKKINSLSFEMSNLKAEQFYKMEKSIDSNLSSGFYNGYFQLKNCVNQNGEKVESTSFGHKFLILNK